MCCTPAVQPWVHAHAQALIVARCWAKQGARCAVSQDIAL